MEDREGLVWDDLWQPSEERLPKLSKAEMEEIRKEHEKLGIKD